MSLVTTADDLAAGSDKLRLDSAAAGWSPTGILPMDIGTQGRNIIVRGTDGDHLTAGAGRTDRTGSRSVISCRSTHDQAVGPEPFNLLDQQIGMRITGG